MAKRKKKTQGFMGRPPKIDKEKVELLLNAVRAGNYIETAAAYAGISKVTVYDWMKKGQLIKEGKKVTSNKNYAEHCVYFSNAIGKALAEAEAFDVQVIAKAAKAGDWRASAWRLERKNHKQWGRKETLREVPADHEDFKGEPESIHDRLVDILAEIEADD